MSGLERDSRLINTYGRHLPTPVMDTVRIEDLSPDDEDYLELMTLIDSDDRLSDMRARAYGESWATQAPSQLTKIIVDLSVLLNTTDGFDSEAMGKELFENTSDTGDSDSLYINIIITKNGSGDDLKTDRRALKKILQPANDETEDYITTAALDSYPGYASPTGQSAYDDASHIESMVGSNQPYIISVPLSDFFTSVRMTTSFDKHNNPILRMSQIQVEGYIKDFNELSDVTIYAAISVGHPKAINGGLSLSTVAYSLSFSDVTYEDVKMDGSLKLFDDAAYMDSEGNYYPQSPLKALNRKYYKIDNFGPVEIINNVKALLAEYRTTAEADPDLREVIEGLNLVLIQYSNSDDLVLMLEKSADVFPEQAGSSRVGVMYERFRRLVVNINNTLMAQEEVVKRIFKNYKIVDARAFTGVPFDSTSYVKDSASGDFLYPKVLHSNIAKYVPIANQSTTYPGDAELPVSPSERQEVYNARRNEIKDAMRALLTNISWNEMEGTRIGESWYDVSLYDYTDEINMARAAALDDDIKELSDLPGIYEIDGDPWKGLDNSESFLVKALAEPIKEAYDWIVNKWSANFVDPLTSYGPEHSGFHAAFSERNRRSDEDRRYPNPSVYSAGCTDAVEGELGGGGYYVPGNQDRYQNTSFRTFFFNVLAGTVTDGISNWDDQYKIPDQMHEKWGLPRNIISSTGANFLSPTHDVIYGAQTDDCIKMSPVICSKDATQQSHRLWGAYYNWGRSFYDVAYTADGRTHYMDRTGVSQLQVFVPRTRPLGDALLPATSLEDWTGTHYEGIAGDDVGGHNIDVFGLLDLKERSVDTIGGIDVFDIQSATTMSIAGSKTAAPITNARWTRRPLYQIKQQIIQLFSNLLGIDPLNGETSISENPDALQFSDPGDYAMASATEPGPGEYSAEPYHGADFVDSPATTGTGGEGSSTTDPVIMAAEALGVSPSGDEYRAVSDSNTGTILDEYLKDMPRQVGEFLYDWLFNEITKLDAVELNSEWERTAIANSLESALITKLDQLLTRYLDNSLCTIIIATQAEHVGSITYGDNPIKYSAIRRVGAANGGATLFPYGDLSKCVLHVGGGGGMASAAGGSARASDHYKVIYIGTRLKTYIRDKILGAMPEVKSLIGDYLMIQGAHIGFQTDTGIHSALSSTDIVVKKYGYFFFDLEKYIRKKSLASQFMNMDRFLANVPMAREMTNTVAQITSVSYTNSAFNGPFNMTLITDTLGGTSDNPVNFESLSLNIPIQPGGSLTPQVYNRIEALQDVTFEEIVDTTYIQTGNTETGMSALEGREVDIDYLAENAEWEYSNLCLRNFSFPGFWDSSFGRAHQTWREDYRLACYRYQYFVDDDNAYLGNSHPMAWAAFPTERDSVDIVNLTTWVDDISHELIIAMMSHYGEIFGDFKNDYVDFAKDNCSFNDFNLRFNDFFIEAMVSKHGTGRSAPWFRMAAAYVQYQNIFTNVFEGDPVRMMESANNILEQIRPETGTLYRLLEFHEKCEEMMIQFKITADKAVEASVGGTKDAFNVNVYVAEPVVDHIGDYTDESDSLLYIIEED